MTHKIKNLEDLISLASLHRVPWVKDPEVHHIALGYLMDFAEDIIKLLQKDLNEIHKIDMPLRYWRIILSPWLMQFLAMTYDRYSLVDGVINDICSAELGVSKNFFITPRNTYEALKLSETEHFNNQILTDIFSLMKASDKIKVRSQTPLIFETIPKFRNENNYKKNILNKISRLLTSKKSIVASYSSIPYQLQLSLIPKVKNLRPIFPYIDGVENYKYPVNINIRRRILEKQKTKIIFKKIVFSILPKYLPICFVEGYTKLKYLSKRYGKAPKVIITGTEMYSRYESYMHWVGESAIKGTKLISMQHGGNYGMELRSEKTIVEINPYDIFYSWGWVWDQYKRTSSSKIKPMPATFLTSIKQPERNKVEKKEILLTVTSIRKTIRRLDCSLMNPYNNQTYFSAQLEFYESLNSQNREQLKVRLYKDDLGNCYKERWLQKFPNISFDKNSSFNQSLRNSKLYVSDHLSTTWLEAITINKPTILFISGRLYDYTYEFKELMNELKEVSVFHESAHSAATFINQNYSNINNWWSSENVQSAISNLQNTLAYTPDNWLEKWANELKTL